VPWALLLVCIGVAGCNPKQHRLSPYDRDVQLSRQLERSADRYCSAYRGGHNLPPYPFRTDGCSMWLNGTWAECCVAHDIAYWCGGTAADRQRADEELGRCVARHESPFLGEMMSLGVRVGGVPWQPFPWRWAYGWDGIRGYD
jgi:hypothetical protein